MDKSIELLKIIIAFMVIIPVFFGVIYGTIQSHKIIVLRLNDKKVILQGCEIFYKDLFNIFLGIPFFLFFVFGPFVLDAKWTGILVLDIIAYCILVIVDGGFFLVMAAKGYMGVIWGFVLGAIMLFFIGELGGFIFS